MKTDGLLIASFIFMKILSSSISKEMDASENKSPAYRGVAHSLGQNIA
jgi:hypothetical protein